MNNHRSPVSGISTFAGKYVLTAGYDNQLILWDAQSKTPLSRGNHDHLVNQCTFSPCGHYAASSSSDYSVRIWLMPNLKLHSVLNGHLDDVEGVAFHPVKRVIATSSRDKTIAVFDYDGRLLMHLHGHDADVISVRWLGDSDNLVSSSDDGTIKHWCTRRGVQIQEIDLDGVETDSVAISDDGALYAGNDDGDIVTIIDNKQSRIRAHDAGIKCLVYDSHQQVLMSLSYDRSMKIWQAGNGQLRCLDEVKFPAIVWPRCGAFLDSDNVVITTFGGAYAQYNLPNQRWELDHIPVTHGYNAVCKLNGVVYCIGDSGIVYSNGLKAIELKSPCNFLQPFSGDLICGGQTGEVFSAITGTCCYQHRSPINCAAVFNQQDQVKLMVGTYTGEGLVFGVNTKSELVFERAIKLHNNAIKGIASSSNSIFTVCADGAVALHCADTLATKCYLPKGHDMIANGCANIGEGRFVSVSRDLKLRIWQGDKAQVIQSPSKNSIKCVASNETGDYVAIGSYTGYIGIYRLSTASWVYWQRVSTAGISAIAYCQDESQQNFIFSTYDGMVYYLDITSLELQQVSY